MIEDNEELTANRELYEIAKRPDGRWIVVYGKDLPQAGAKWKGTADYSTRKAAEDAIQGKSLKRGMFDRFMLDIEPEPVEWNGDADGSADEVEDEAPKEGMLSPISPAAGINIFIMLGGSGMLKGKQ